MLCRRLLLLVLIGTSTCVADESDAGYVFFEKKIRPLFVKHCYDCHSEEAGERQGGLLLDRRIGWIKGGDTEEAILPGEPNESLLIKAIEYDDDNLQMPPDGRLTDEEIGLLRRWVTLGAPGPSDDKGDTEFSRLGDQDFLFEQAKDHWSFQPVRVPELQKAARSTWNHNPIDQLVAAKLSERGLTASKPADSRTLIRRLTYDLTGLPPTFAAVEGFAAVTAGDNREGIAAKVDELLSSPAFGEHLGRLWLDVARYGDTDGNYRPDTKTPHYYPFAFTYRDYVIEAFNTDKPFDQFVREQLAADLLDLPEDAPELAGLGFLTVGPHANRNEIETVDDWIDTTSRGLLGLTVACARCHDHKYEPVPTADYYSMRGVFASSTRIHPLKENQLPILASYEPTKEQRKDYEAKRAAIDEKIEEATGKKAKNNNRSVAQKIRETELAELLLFHPGAPARAMVVKEKSKPVQPVVFIRGQADQLGERIPRRFLQLLDPEQTEFPKDSSGRLQLAERIVDETNPMTARVFVNRIWGALIGSHIVATPSDFGLQGARPSHPELLDWLAADFVSNGWSIKHLVKQIVTSQTYQQSSANRTPMTAIDSENTFLWRANRKRLSIEALRDSILAVSKQLDRTPRGRSDWLWKKNYTKRRAIYGYINRFNLDPTLRAFDFPTPMQSHPGRDESIVPTQSLFTLNSQFVIDQSLALAELPEFQQSESDDARVQIAFSKILQRKATAAEIDRISRFVSVLKQRKRTKTTDDAAMAWPMAVQALMMSNEFQYVD